MTLKKLYEKKYDKNEEEENNLEELVLRRRFDYRM
jgi:hypothetical protein